MNGPRFTVILLAAGSSTRFGGGGAKKPYCDLLGRAVWRHSLDRFAGRADVSRIVVAVAPTDEAMFHERFAEQAGQGGVTVVHGGSERYHSVSNALAAVGACDFVAVHDTARPCLTDALVDAVFAAAAEHGAALLATPVRDTVKRADADGRVTATVPRDGLWLAQTPQVFRRGDLTRAYGLLGTMETPVTDDTQLVEALGTPVHVVASDAGNLKITVPEDLALAAAVLRARKEER